MTIKAGEDCEFKACMSKEELEVLYLAAEELFVNAEKAWTNKFTADELKRKSVTIGKQIGTALKEVNDES
jgi:hypothetical protein